MQKSAKDKIRVLQIIHSSEVTGPGVAVLGLVANFDRDEIISEALCPSKGWLADEMRALDIPIIPFDINKRWNIFYTLPLMARLKARRYHVFHIHSGQLTAWSKIVCALLSIPAVVMTEHVAAVKHTWIRNNIKLRLHLLFHGISNLIGDKIIAVSESARKYTLERQGVDPDKVVTIYNGLVMRGYKAGSVDKQGLRKRWLIPDGAPVIGIIGRLHIEKGIETFIRAAQIVAGEFSNARFFVIGEGELKGHLEALARELAIADRVVFTGFQQNIFGIMDLMDIIVQPSLPLSESFGLTVIEAMSLGKPVVISDIGCFREIVREGESGLFFSSADHNQLAKKLIMLLKDRALCLRLGEQARADVRTRFDIRSVARKTSGLYKEILNGKARSAGKLK